MKLAALTIVTGLLLSSSAFAWGGGGNPTPDPQIPVNTPDANGKIIGQSARVSLTLRNKIGVPMECDVMGRVKAYYRGDINDNSIEVKRFIDRLQVPADGQTEATFTFKSQFFAKKYKLSKPSLRVKSACLDLTENENQGSHPPPHTTCDPEFEKCGWTCQSSQQSANQCADENQDWNDSDDAFL